METGIIKVKKKKKEREEALCVFETFRQQRESLIESLRQRVWSLLFLFYIIILVIIKKTVKYGCFCVKVFFKTTMFYWLLSVVSFEKIYMNYFFYFLFFL